MIYRVGLIFLTFLLLSSCAGKIKTYSSPKVSCDRQGDNCHYEGVFYRPLVQRDRVFVHDRILAAKETLTHHMLGKDGERCTPVKVTVTELVPSKQEFLINYDPAFFEGSTFSVDLNANGTLSKVGSSSTPGGKALVESLVSLATTREALLQGAMPEMEMNGGFDRSNDPFCSHGELGLPPS